MVTGDDINSGAGGNDKIKSGDGNDENIGGDGADKFNCGKGADTVTGFDESEDKANENCENVS